MASSHPPARSRPFGGRGSNSMLLAALLVGTLAVATMLAYEAHNAARSHRATAERALHDYAAVAAWEVVAGVNEALQSSVGGALAPVTRTQATSPYELLPAPSVLATSADNALRCLTPAADSLRFYFRVDFRDRSLASFGGTAPPSAAMRAWLVDTIASHGRGTYKPDWTYAIILGAPPGEQRAAIAYAVKYAEHSAPVAAYGFRTCEDVVGAPMIRDLLMRRSLLPLAVTGGAGNDSIVGVVVRDHDGRTIFQSEHAQFSPYSADVPLDQAGGLAAHVTIRPRAVEVLAFGAIPDSHVPILVALLTLTAAMVAVTIMQLRRENELARLRADFISSVSHELRTPLSQILLFAETLSLGRVRTEQERHSATGVIVQEGRRLMHLVENILHFSRAERRMTRLGPETLNLSRAVQVIVDDWLPLATAADMRIVTQFGADVYAVADPSALRQMVLNLLDNAVKYGPSVQTVTVGTSKAAGRVRVWVDDEGQGIPARERERVWDSFYRLQRDASSSVAGSGIGLYVVRELARLHGGDAWVEDAPDGGARFVIELDAGEPSLALTDGLPAAATDAPTLEPRA